MGELNTLEKEQDFVIEPVNEENVDIEIEGIEPAQDITVDSQTVVEHSSDEVNRKIELPNTPSSPEASEVSESLEEDGSIVSDVASSDVEKKTIILDANGEVIADSNAAPAPMEDVKPVFLTIRFKTKDGSRIYAQRVRAHATTREGREKNQKVIEKAEEARAQGKEINGAVKEDGVMNKTIEKSREERELKKSERIIEGQDVTKMNDLEIEKHAIEAQQKVSEMKAQTSESLVAQGKYVGEADQTRENAEAQRTANEWQQLAKEKNIDLSKSEDMNEAKKEEVEKAKEVEAKKEEKTAKFVEKSEQLEGVVNKIEDINGAYRTGDISTEEFAKKMAGLQEQKSDLSKEISGMDVSEIKQNAEKEHQNDEIENEVIGETGKDLDGKVFAKEIEAKEDTFERNKDIRAEKIEDAIETVDTSTERVYEAVDKTEDKVDDLTTNYADNSVGRAQYESLHTTLEGTKMQNALDSNEMRNGPIEEPTKKSEILEKRAECAEITEKSSDLAAELSHYDKNAIAATEKPEVAVEIAEAQQVRSEQTIETREVVRTEQMTM